MEERAPGAADTGRTGLPADVLDEAGTARAVVDEHGIVTEWSEGARRLLGHRPDEIVGRPVARLLDLDPDVAADTLRRARASPRWNGRVPLRHLDGYRVEAGVIAHRRAEGTGDSGWLLVSPLTGAADPDDEALVPWSFEQSPCCAVTLFDTRLRLRRANRCAERAGDLPEAEMRGLRVPEIMAVPQSDQVERSLLRVLRTGEPQHLDLHLRAPGESSDHAWAVFLSPLRDEEGALRGIGVWSHDTTEQHWARQRLQLISDAGTRIGSTLDVARTAQELADVAVPEIADLVLVDLFPDPDSPDLPGLPGLPEAGPGPPGAGPGPDAGPGPGVEPGPDAGPGPGAEPRPPDSGPGPPGAAEPVRLRRVAQQSVLPGTPEAVLPLGAVDGYAVGSPTFECMATGRPVLRTEYDPSDDDWSAGHPQRESAIRAFGVHSLMAVPLRARGTTLGVAVFARHRRPEPFGEDDLLVAGEITARAAVSIDNARRYSRERGTAVELQRTLLPQGLPHQAAVEVASRYLPTGALAGVGGDWFDVIPLSSARVALVVGDVVGHGIQAAATMGRLRTAVRTLADVDLPPDELLTHLDDLVVRLYAEAGQNDASRPALPDRNAQPAQNSQPAENARPVQNTPNTLNAPSAPNSPTTQSAEIAGGFGATCLYAVYDPVSRVCTLARAGHPVPAVVSPSGTVDLLDVPAGPPLGLGGLPFETAEVTLPEGSILALYTDGLIESRGQDIDAGIGRLRRALAHPAGSLDDLCDAVLGSLPPERRSDDIALLVARTRTLDARHVATWDLPADPAVVAQARKLVSAQLNAWGLTEAAYLTELLVSELVTNAIRHADPPIQLRLILDRHLICEVSDATSTAPHLRRARTYDEGGRGLLLVAQLTRGWGTRQTDTGKTIWAEQSLDDTRPAA